MRTVATVGEALEEALEKMPLAPTDIAAVTLARRYAAGVDLGSPDALETFGPKLLATLESLRMTPRARAAIVKGGAPDVPAGRTELDAARERRSTRPHRASPLDTSAT